jgi:hypothetical protein
MKKIGFWDNNLCFRGTTEAMYDYADYNEKILNNKSVIFSLKTGDLKNLEKFQNRFEVILFDNFRQCDDYITNNNFDFIYVIKYGNMDEIYSNNVPTLVHAVFHTKQPHGYKYFYVSDYLAKLNNYSIENHSLPHIVKKIDVQTPNLREKLNIPENCTVFGYHGGPDEFNIDCAKQVVINTLHDNENIYFLFMSINKFVDHPRAIFLESTLNKNNEKLSYIRACDAMLHARSGGETFGCSLGEFAIENKPIITYAHYKEGLEAHLDILKEYAIKYENYEQLYHILNNFSQYKKFAQYDTPYLEFSPEKIMERFNSLLN